MSQKCVKCGATGENVYFSAVDGTSPVCFSCQQVSQDQITHPLDFSWMGKSEQPVSVVRDYTAVLDRIAQALERLADAFERRNKRDLDI